jgi:orotate phosphoribosyltransferase
MQSYKCEFIEFMVRSGVLLFGEFTTKSGRISPYFINTGRYETGEQMTRLGRAYAQAIIESVGGEVDVLFGPAYKGIPLVVTTAVALHEEHGMNVAFAFNRKEAKDHGEGGSVVGHGMHDSDRVVIVEDVTTAGTSIRESVALLDAIARVRYTGVIVSVDRMEKGNGETSALVEIGETFGIPVYPIVTLDEIVEHLHNREIDGRVMLDERMMENIAAYRAKYGARG